MKIKIDTGIINLLFLKNFKFSYCILIIMVDIRKKIDEAVSTAIGEYLKNIDGKSIEPIANRSNGGDYLLHQNEIRAKVSDVLSILEKESAISDGDRRYAYDKGFDIFEAYVMKRLKIELL